MRLNEQQFNEAIQYLKESKNTLKLYHLSKDRNLSKMTPRIPKSKYEEQKTPRICFSTSIDGCLIGINENKNIEGEIFHVYSITTSDYYKPNTTEVADVHITNEIWVTKPVEVKYEYSIKVTGKKGTRKEKINGNTFEVPEWKYEKVDNLREAIQYLEESQEVTSFKTPEELYKWMRKNIKYAGPYDIIRGPENLLKNKKGQCHEQAMFALKYLKRMGLNPQYHFVYNLDKDKQYIDGNGATHAFVTFKRDNNVYWFETAWSGQAGIHEYKNYTELKNDVLMKLMQTSRPEIKYYDWIDGLRGRAGMGIWEFCLNYINPKTLKKHNKQWR